MKIQTYRQKDSFHGVTVYELGTVDYPFRDFIEKRGVDIQAVRSYLNQYFSRNQVPYDPEEILPLLPTEFEYEHDGSRHQVEDGIVFSRSVDALMNFAKEQLLSVTYANSISGQFSVDDEPGLQDQSEFLQQIQMADDLQNVPYDAQPLMYLPNSTSEQSSHRGRGDLTVNFFQEEIGNDTWMILKFKTVNELLRNPRRFQTKSVQGDSVNVNLYNLNELEPIYVQKQNLTSRETNPSSPYTWNFVAGCREQQLDRQYIWSFRDRSGTAITGGELPVELCEEFEKNGRQIIEPGKFSRKAPIRFLEPKAFVGGDWNELRDLQSRTLPDRSEWIEDDSAIADLLDDPLYVRDLRQPMSFQSLYDWRKEKRDEKIKESTVLEVLDRFNLTEDEIPQLKQYSMGELGEMTLQKFLDLTGLTLRDLREASSSVHCRFLDEPPTILNTELLAKILQRTEQTLYHPEQPPAGYDCMDNPSGSSTIWYGLCEPQYHG